jgi:pyruvate dehydrogenase E1 component beta subunit
LNYSGKLLIIEEGYSFAGWGSEVISRVIEHNPSLLKGVLRVSMPEYPIPSSGPLEIQMLPNTDNVLAAVKELYAHE